MEVKVYRLDNSLVRKSQLWLVGRRHENHKKELVDMATPYKVYGCRQVPYGEAVGQSVGRGLWGNSKT